MKHTFILRPNDTGPLSNLMTWIASRDTSKTWEVRIQEYKDSKSDAQNRLQWMWHAAYATHFGCTKEYAYNRF